MTSGAISRASSSQIITTNKPTSDFLQAVLSPNQQCQSTEGKVKSKFCSN